MSIWIFFDRSEHLFFSQYFVTSRSTLTCAFPMSLWCRHRVLWQFSKLLRHLMHSSPDILKTPEYLAAKVYFATYDCHMPSVMAPYLVSNHGLHPSLSILDLYEYRSFEKCHVFEPFTQSKFDSFNNPFSSPKIEYRFSLWPEGSDIAPCWAYFRENSEDQSPIANLVVDGVNSRTSTD